VLVTLTLYEKPVGRVQGFIRVTTGGTTFSSSQLG